jgi:hypothetical protein
VELLLRYEGGQEAVNTSWQASGSCSALSEERGRPRQNTALSAPPSLLAQLLGANSLSALVGGQVLGVTSHQGRGRDEGDSAGDGGGVARAGCGWVRLGQKHAIR